jgi:manganese transport protein
MDPGNWATDLEGGARFGYQLLWVLVMSNFMAILLQTLSARLGIVSGRDLAQACREHYPRRISYVLWVLCEIAIAACDLAEVLGAAIALNLLFHIPLLAGVLITTFDTLLVLWLTNFGIRLIEAVVLGLVVTIGGCFLVEILFAKPHMAQVLSGLVPHLTDQSLYVAIGILGATVMPHNLYLHSALVQTRRIGASEKEKAEACKFNLIDSVVALNAALFVNAAILILAAAVFYQRGMIVTEIQQAHLLLAPLLGTTAASVLFGVALLCSGQSSTLTGTMAGQIVMEGFLNFRMRPWLRRLVTRMIAVVPAAITIYLTGDQGTYKLLILSQVILSMQLPFAVIPLIHFTSEKSRMGPFVNRPWVRTLAWSMALVIVGLNIRLVYSVIGDWVNRSAAYRYWILAGVIPLCGGLLLLLAWVTLQPWLPGWMGRRGLAPISLPEAVASNLQIPAYHRILVPLDHSNRDHVAIAHAAAMARTYSAKLFLLHVEEGVTSQIYGALSSTAEVEAGRKYLDDIVEKLRGSSIEVEAVVRHSDTPRDEIVRYAKSIQPDLLVMGAHGHAGWKDLVFGTTINAVRHKLDVPILVVRDRG